MIRSTEFYSPYPDDIPFKKPDLVLKNVFKKNKKDIDLNVEFVQNSRYRVLIKKKGK